MNTKTYLSMHIPGFFERWKRYKRGVKGKNLKEWCISSDYVNDKKKPNCVATFTIFPKSLIPQIIREIRENAPTDIKNMTQVSPKTSDYIKNSPYFFSISVIIKNKKLLCNPDLLKSIETIIKTYNNFNEEKSLFREKYKKIQKFNQYMKQNHCSKETIGLLLYVAKFVSYICEFLLIKENNKIVHWFSDRDSIVEFSDKIIYDFIVSYTESLVHTRISDYNISAPIVNTEEHQKEYDTLIRIPDIISGVLSSLHPKGNNLAYEKVKHRDIFLNSILSNEKIVIIDVEIQKNNLQNVREIMYFKPDEVS